MALTIKQCINAKPGRLSDGAGLYLLTKPAKRGVTRSWVLRVQADGKRRDIGLGSFTPDLIPVDIPLDRRSQLTLEQARKKARLWREIAKAGVNPRDTLKAVEAPTVVTFRSAAEDCHKHAKRG